MQLQGYSFSHATTVKWALEMELNRLKCIRPNNEEIMEFLSKRIQELKDYEKECLKIQGS